HPASRAERGEVGMFGVSERIWVFAVPPQRPLDKPVIIGISRGRKQHAIQPNAARFMVDFVFIALPLGDLDRDVEMHVLSSVSVRGKYTASMPYIALPLALSDPKRCCYPDCL